MTGRARNAEQGTPTVAPNNAMTTALDPTLNVQNLLKEAIKRQDDLHNALVSRIDERFVLEKGYVEQRLEAEKHHIDEIITLRSLYEEKLREAESSRINAIRQMDATAVSLANDRATQQATVLANQVSTSADTLRALVASTASSVAQQLEAVTRRMTDRLEILEKASYEGKGRESYTDPMITTMLQEIKSMRETMQMNVGKGVGATNLWGYIVGGIGLLSVILTIVLKIMGV